MDEFTTVIGKIIRWMGRVFSLGQMVADMKVNIKMIRKKGMEFSHGQMAEHMKVVG